MLGAGCRARGGGYAYGWVVRAGRCTRAHEYGTDDFSFGEQRKSIVNLYQSGHTSYDKLLLLEGGDTVTAKLGDH